MSSSIQNITRWLSISLMVFLVFPLALSFLLIDLSTDLIEIVLGFILYLLVPVLTIILVILELVKNYKFGGRDTIVEKVALIFGFLWLAHMFISGISPIVIFNVLAK